MAEADLEKFSADFLTERLRANGALPRGRVIAVDAGERCPAIIFTAAPLRVEYSSDAPHEAPRRLFLKATRIRLAVDRCLSYWRSAPLLLLFVLTTGCATATPPALSAQLEEHQRLANSLRHRVRIHGGWAPEDNLGLVQPMPVWRNGFGGLDIWLRGDIVGTQCGQYVIASLLALRERPSADGRTVNEDAVKSLVSVGWTAQAAEAARASCPGAPAGGAIKDTTTPPTR